MTTAEQGWARPTLRPDGPPTLLRTRPTVEVLDALDAVEAIAAEWAELADAAAASPFVAPGYALAWWRHLGRGDMHVVTARHQGTLVALAPLHRRSVLGRPVLRWLGHGMGTVAEVLVRPGYGAAADAVWSHVAQDRSVLLDLVEYRDDGGGLAELRRCSDLTTTATLRDVCPVIGLGALTSSDDLLARLHRRHPLRRAVERGRRALDAEGRAFTVTTRDSPAGLHEVLDDLERVHDAAEAHRPRQHLLRPPWRGFVLGWLEERAAAGALAVHVGRIGAAGDHADGGAAGEGSDGTAVAFEVCLLGREWSHHWISRFDPSAAAYSPGHLVTLAAIDDARGRGVRWSDQLIGDGPHKRPWADASYDTLTVRAAPVARAALARRSALVDARARAVELARHAVAVARR